MKRLLCMVGLHDYKKRVQEGGDAYLECTRCGRDSYPSGIAGGGILPY